MDDKAKIEKLVLKEIEAKKNSHSIEYLRPLQGKIQY